MPPATSEGSRRESRPPKQWSMDQSVTDIPSVPEFKATLNSIPSSMLRTFRSKPIEKSLKPNKRTFKPIGKPSKPNKRTSKPTDFSSMPAEAGPAGSSQQFDYFVSRPILESSSLPSQRSAKQTLEQLDLPACLDQRMDFVDYAVTDGHIDPSAMNPGLAHPLAGPLAERGYKEPGEWELWRTNGPHASVYPRKNIHHAVSGAGRDGRYFVARKDLEIWALPLPYEPFQWFLERQQHIRGPLSEEDQEIVERQFWWREDHDPVFRYPSKIRTEWERLNRGKHRYTAGYTPMRGSGDRDENGEQNE